MAEPNYEINYEDERFQKVEQDKQQAMTEVDNTYSGMIDQTDRYYQQQIDASKQWSEQQQQAQQAQTDLLIEQTNQQKAQAEKDYKKEQTGAYVDWQKQSNAYGANAEQMAANGLTNSGYSESSQVAMYTTYQNRVAIARESFNMATMNFDNNIKEAMLQNSVKKAEIAYQQYQKELELSLQGFQYKNALIQEQVSKKQELENMYHSRWQEVLQQMNHENAMAEQIRQYNEQQAEQVRQYNEQMAFQKQQATQQQKNWEKEYALNKKSVNASIAKQKAAQEQKIQKDPESEETIDQKKVTASYNGMQGIYSLTYKQEVAKGASDYAADKAAKNKQRDSLYILLSNDQINNAEYLAISEKLGL